MIATFCNSSENVRTLIKNGADIYLFDLDGDSALDHAVMQDSHDALTALLEEAGPTISLFELEPGSLSLIAHQADIKSLQILIEHAENLKVVSNQSEEIVGSVLGCAWSRKVANESSDTGYLLPFNEKPFDQSEVPTEWFHLFAELACRIYNLEKNRFEEVCECGSEEDDESGDGANSSKFEDHDSNDGSGCEEEQCHDTREG